MTALPKGLRVGGHAYVSGAPISALPDGLSVGGNMYWSAKGLALLPEGLSVGRFLDVRGTAITGLPESLRVGHSRGVDVSGSSGAMFDGVSIGGNFCFAQTLLKALPERLTVGGALCLSETNPLTEVPGEFSIGQGLYLRKWINIFPPKQDVEGSILTDFGLFGSVDEARAAYLSHWDDILA